MAACFKSGVTLKVKESCVFCNSGTALLISSGRVRVLEFNCFFESQVSV